MVAISSGNVEAAEYLLSLKTIDVQHTDVFGKSADEYAEEV
tara:strand:+ start:823 stop:945 length:123 start_codon:yes stop_codon:yes gene_type:complete